jgi:hypothetical protein
MATREFIVTKYVIPGALFTNEDFRRTVMQASLTKYADSEKPSSSIVPTGLSKTVNRGTVSVPRVHTRNADRKRIRDRRRVDKRDGQVYSSYLQPDPGRQLRCHFLEDVFE